MKIVILGATGQVGHELRRALPAIGEVVAHDKRTANLEQPDDVVAILASERPDVIVNAAAYTAVDRAESEPDRAMLVNGTAVAAIAAEARRQGSLFVHYSTDYVFDGQAPSRYRETDPPRPLSVYGRSKLAGDLSIAASGCRHYVFRTSWVYAIHGTNFLKTMLRLACERDDLAVIADQRGVPTSAGLIAAVTAEFVQRAFGGSPAPWGLYNLTPRGETTWHGYATLVLRAARDRGLSLRVPPEAVRAIATSDYPTAACRPANSLLSTEKLEAALARALPNWEDPVLAAVTELATAQP